MTPAALRPPTICFDIFGVDLPSSELRKSGRRVKLQEGMGCCSSSVGGFAVRIWHMEDRERAHRSRYSVDCSSAFGGYAGA